MFANCELRCRQQQQQHETGKRFCLGLARHFSSFPSSFASRLPWLTCITVNGAHASSSVCLQMRLAVAPTPRASLFFYSFHVDLFRCVKYKMQRKEEGGAKASLSHSRYLYRQTTASAREVYLVCFSERENAPAGVSRRKICQSFLATWSHAHLRLSGALRSKSALSFSPATTFFLLVPACRCVSRLRSSLCAAAVCTARVMPGSTRIYEYRLSMEPACCLVCCAVNLNVD